MRRLLPLCLLLSLAPGLIAFNASAQNRGQTTATPSQPPIQVEIKSPPEPFVNKLLPVVFSGLALAFSVFSLIVTTYNQYLKKPRLRLLPGERIKLFWAHDESLVLAMNMTLFNDGAQFEGIYKLYGVISEPEANVGMEFEWRMFVETKNVGTSGATFQPHDEFAGWAETLVVPARQAVAKRIQFSTLQRFELAAGQYTIEFLGLSGRQMLPACRAKIEFTVSTKQATDFKATKADLDTKLSKSSIRLAVRHLLLK